MSRYKINTVRKLPRGLKSLRNRRKIKLNLNEQYPLTEMKIGESFYVPGNSARDMRNIIHTETSGTQGRKYVSETTNTLKKYGVTVWRRK